MNVLHCLDVSSVGGIQDFILNLHLYDHLNRHDFWAADGTMAAEMRRSGMVLWPGGPPQGLLDARYYQVCVGHTVGGWSYNDTFEWAKSHGMKTVEVMHSNARSPTPPVRVDAFVSVNDIALGMNNHMPTRQRIYPIVKAELFSVRPDGMYIGRISRLVDEKKPHVFVQIARAFPNEMFVCTGDGNAYPRVYASAGPNLIMPGMLRGEQIVKFFETLKLFVFPTEDECASMSVAMAQAAGVPVICQDIPPLRETTGGYALFATGVDSFVDCVKRFLDSEDRSEWQDRADLGEVWAYTNFSPDSVVPKWHALFESLR